MPFNAFATLQFADAVFPRHYMFGYWFAGLSAKSIKPLQCIFGLFANSTRQLHEGDKFHMCTHFIWTDFVVFLFHVNPISRCKTWKIAFCELNTIWLLCCGMTKNLAKSANHSIDGQLKLHAILLLFSCAFVCVCLDRGVYFRQSIFLSLEYFRLFLSCLFRSILKRNANFIFWLQWKIVFVNIIHITQTHETHFDCI